MAEIPTEEAIKYLPEGDHVHTFVQSGSMIVGADWKRADVIRAFQEHGALTSGDTARGMKHGLAFYDGKRNYFVETATLPPEHPAEESSGQDHNNH